MHYVESFISHIINPEKKKIVITFEMFPSNILIIHAMQRVRISTLHDLLQVRLIRMNANHEQSPLYTRPLPLTSSNASTLVAKRSTTTASLVPEKKSRVYLLIKVMETLCDVRLHSRTCFSFFSFTTQ